MLRSSLVLLLCLSALVAAPAAPAAPPRAGGVDVQQFKPGAGASDYLDILGGFPARHLSLSGGLYFNYAQAPLLGDRDGVGDKVSLLDSQAAFDLLLSMSLWEHLELGITLPIVGMHTAGPAWRGHPGLEGPDEGFGLGDVRVTPKVKVIGVGRSFALSIAAPLQLPMGDGFAGYGDVSIEPTLVADFVPASYFRLTLNAGGRFRPTARFADLELTRELLWGVGFKLSFLLGDQPFSVATAFSGSFELPNQPDEPPLEFVSGLEWHGLPDLSVLAGVGAGLTRGPGAPDLRVVFGVRYTTYRDCVYGPEDYDGFDDDDRCADLDNDLDDISDELDVCPNEPETYNGLDDDDGCPDAHPTFATLGGLLADDAARGDALGYERADADADADGVADAVDACPTQPEDLDGFQDSDGCPDPDNDADGIVDLDDGCPEIAETANGFDDADGCPDSVPTMARVDDETATITITDKVYFEIGKDIIQRRSYELLDQIALVMGSRPDIELLEVGGHTDSIGSARYNRRLSQRRADAVRVYLVDKGIAGNRVVAKGFGESAPIADNATAQGRSQNRRVEFRILQYRNEPAAGGLP